MSNSDEYIKYKIIFTDNTEYHFRIHPDEIFTSSLYDRLRYWVSDKSLSDVLCCIKDLKEISLP